MTWIRGIRPLRAAALLSITLAATLAGAATALAQQLVAADAPNTVVERSVLDRPVSVRVHRVALRDAIDQVAENAKVRVQYKSEAVANQGPVSLDVSAVPLRQALGQLLAGTSLVVVPLDETSVGLVKSDAAALLDRLVNLDVKRMPLGDVLDAISSQVGLRFIYDEDILPTDKRISFAADHLPVGAALKHLLKGFPVTFEASSRGTMTFRATQEGGKISGQVIDSTTGRAVAHATVLLQGTKYVTTTNSLGTFSFSRLPAGTYTVTVRMLGYASQHATVVVGDKATSVTLALRTTSTMLTEVVTTGSGDQERLSVGNSISTINADSVVANQAIYNLSKLLEARVPGLNTVPTSGAVGAATRLNLRGFRSANASNDPIVILDGVRMTSENAVTERDQNLQGKYNRPGRLDDIDPATIESIDVLKGASASSLYGSDAANGVIVIKTKRGRPGPARWSLSGDRSMTKFPESSFPTAVKAFGHDRQGYNGLCILQYYSIGYCPILDSVVTSNPLTDYKTTPFAIGYDNKVAADVSGGTETLRYYLSGSYLDQLGASRIPRQNVAIFERVHGAGSASNAFIRPNAQTNTNFTGTMTAGLGAVADAAVTSTLLGRYQRRGNEGLQAAYSVLISPSDSTTPVNGAQGSANQRTDNIKRSFTSVSGKWHPTSWFNASANFGYDLTIDNDRDFVPRNGCQPFCGQSYGGEYDSTGVIWFGRRQTETRSGEAQGTIQFPMPAAFTMMTSGGVRANRNQWDDFQGFMSNLAAGRTIPYEGSGGRQNIGESQDETATAGWFLVQKLAWRERMFLQAGFQRDKGSALGDDVAPLYPKWAFSYLMSDESYFEPLRKYFDTFRIRAAFGHAGIQPGSTQRLRSFSQLVRYVPPTGALENYATLSGLGNENLRPERSVETEWGFDADLLDSRVHLLLTKFRSTALDAILPRPLAPSVGAVTSNGIAPTRLENVGTTRNTGTEMEFSVNVVRSALVNWYSGLTYAAHKSMMVKLGPNVRPYSNSGNSDGNIAIRGVDDARLANGYPLFGRWARPVVGFYDANANGIIDRDEVRYGDTLVYVGSSEPKYNMSINNDLQLFNGRLNVSTTLQYVNGLSQINNYGASLEGNTANGVIQGTLSPQGEAYAVAYNGAPTPYGYIENVNTLRFTAMSVTYVLPQRLSRRLRATQTSLSFIGSNIGMWSTYRGADPSVNTTGPAGNRLSDDGGLPQPRTWGLRARLNF